MKEINFDELMELYRKTTPGKWRKILNKNPRLEFAKYEISNDEGPFWIAQVGPEVDVSTSDYDADLIVALHNYFPAIVERLRVAEKMAEIIENKPDDECPFVGISEIECRKAGYSCNQCVRSNLRKVALTKLGLKEVNDGK